MEEIYTFAARVAARWPRQIQLVPENQQAFLDYLDRAQLICDPFWHGDEVWVSVGQQSLIARSEGVERVTYAVQAKPTRRGREMHGVALEPLH